MLKNFFEWFKREDSSAEQKRETLGAPSKSSLELVEEYAIGENLYQIFRIHDDRYIYQDFGEAYYRNGDFLFMGAYVQFAPIGADRSPLVKILIRDHTPEWNYLQGLFTLDGVFVAPIYRTRYLDTTSDLAWYHFRTTTVFDLDVLSLLEKVNSVSREAIGGGLPSVPTLMTSFSKNAQKLLPAQVLEAFTCSSRRLSTLDFYESNWRSLWELADDEYICEELEHWGAIYRKNGKYYYKYKAPQQWKLIFAEADYMTFIRNPFGHGVLLKVIENGVEKLYKYPYHTKEQVGNNLSYGGGTLRRYK